MKYETLYNDFIDLFPSKKAKLEEYAKKASADPSDGMHIMFGMVIIPFLLDLLNDNDQSSLKVAFSFFEQMEESNDQMILEVLEFTVLENIVSKGKNISTKLTSYMGRKTLESFYTIEKYLL